MQRKITNAVSAFDTYLQLVELSESPLIFHRWCFISAMGTMLGRKVWLPFGEEVIYPNQYVVLIGPPGSRKSAAIKTIGTLMDEAGYQHFGPDKSTKEKFMIDWEHGFDKINRGVEPGKLARDNPAYTGAMEELFETTIGIDKSKVSEVFIKSGELQDFLGSGNADFIVTLTNLWDNLPKYTDRFKNSKDLYIPNPTINLLGGATTTTFSSVFSSNIAGQGMLSRLVLVHGKGQRMRLTIPPPLPAGLKASIIDYLSVIANDFHGALTLDEDAFDALHWIYQNWVDLPDSRLLTYSGRRQTHLIKLMIISAVSDFRMNINLQDVILANSILTYTELSMPKALGEFGKSRNSGLSQVILDTIYQGTGAGGYSAREIFKAVGQDAENMNEVIAVLTKLIGSGEIRSVDGQGEDSIPVYLPVKRQIVTTSKYLDLDLLYEHKFKEAE
jgi:hypothetical protein